MLDARRLRVLAEVARCGSLSAAAAALDYTPSAVSQQIAALERETGATLLERGPRGVTLTEPGATLARHAERIMSGLDAAEADVRALADLRTGLLRIGWFTTAGATLMPRAIAAFRNKHPDVRLTLLESDPDDCERRLRERELDLALIYEFESEGAFAPDLPQVDLLTDRLRVALHPGHRLAGRRRLKLAELAQEPWIQGVRAGSTLAILPTACRAAGFEPIIAFRTEDHGAVEGLVAAGVGVGLVPELMLPSARADIALCEVTDPPLVRTVRAALAPGRYRSPAAAAMLEVLADVATELAGQAAQRFRSASRRSR
jgi:molybdate transport repressor ModE-like protein